MDKNTRYFYFFLLLLCALVHISGLFYTIMGTDGTLYASVARTMAETGDYVNLYAQGNDWLDKPHFPFWVTAVFFKFFGVSTFTYKLPAVLFTLWGSWMTYRLGKQLYSKEVGLIASIMLLSAQHLIMSDADVRAEAYLTSLIVSSVYFFVLARRKSGYRGYLILACFFAGSAAMTKGIFALIIIGAAIGGDLIIRRRWSELFQWRWLAAIGGTFLFLFPELFVLYRQFDLHPEKVVFGKTQVSGLKFFFWDSQFGRFNNSGPIKGAGDPFFFMHTLLWAYLPWCTFFYAAIVGRVAGGFNKFAKPTEWVTISAAVVGLLMFSISKFQLPHYANVLFPFFSIITANYLVQSRSNRGSLFVALTKVQWVVIPILFLLPFLIRFGVKPAGAGVFTWMVVPFFVAIVVFGIRAKRTIADRLLFWSVVAVCWTNFYLNLEFFPFVMKFQSGSEAAFWLNAHNPGEKLFHTNEHGSAFAFEFYSKQNPSVWKGETLPATPFIAYVQSARQDSLKNSGVVFENVKVFPHYHVSKLTPGFLNPSTRDKTLGSYSLIRVTGRKKDINISQ